MGFWCGVGKVKGNDANSKVVLCFGPLLYVQILSLLVFVSVTSLRHVIHHIGLFVAALQLLTETTLKTLLGVSFKDGLTSDN